MLLSLVLYLHNVSQSSYENGWNNMLTYLLIIMFWTGCIKDMFIAYALLLNWTLISFWLLPNRLFLQEAELYRPIIELRHLDI